MNATTIRGTVKEIRPITVINPQFSQNHIKLAQASRHILLGICAYCGGNVKRVKHIGETTEHAECMHCSKDLCCPSRIPPPGPDLT